VLRTRRLIPLALALLLAAAACDGDAGGDGEAVPVRLGFFPNLTHAPALVGVESGLFEEALGDGPLELRTFNAGPEAVEALFSGAVDVTYLGPNPAINAYAQSGGEAVRILAGSTSGGAALVVRDGIDDADDLAGATLATPQLGNTQDVALRSWLADQGYGTDTTGGGDVSISPRANADTLAALQAGSIDGAWVPEPWVTRLVHEGGGHVLVDERDLWPDGRFVTTHLVARTEFLDAHPDLVRRLLRAHLAALDAIAADPEAARSAANARLAAITDQPLDDAVLTEAWSRLEFTADPIAASLDESARDAVAVGLLEPVDLDGIYALDLLNGLLDSEVRDL
jgi:NitT/TauT family transport system substrate-binding protein